MANLIIRQLYDPTIVVMETGSPLPELPGVVQRCVAVMLEELLGSRERNVGLEVRVLQLEETMEIADRMHPSKVDSSVCVSVCDCNNKLIDISHPRIIFWLYFYLLQCPASILPSSSGMM